MFNKNNQDPEYKFKYHLLGILLGIFVCGALAFHLGGKDAVGVGILFGFIIGEILGLLYTKK